MTKDRTTRIRRRSFLAGLGTTAAANLVRPIIAQAQSKTGAPQRLLLIHRPCGTAIGGPAGSPMDKWWPSGGTTNWVSSPIISSFDQLRNDMVIVKGVDCPRIQGWLGDKHGAGMIAMTSPSPKDKGSSDRHVWPVLPGYTVAQQNDTNGKFFTAPDMSIDQLFLKKIASLQGTRIPSLQTTASMESADVTAPSCLRVVSYSKSDPMAVGATPLWPESRPDVVFKNVFGSAMMNMGADQLAKIQAQNKSLLDYLTGDLQALRPQVPLSQLPKIDQHLSAIRDLEKNLRMVGTGRACAPPTLAALPTMASGMSLNDAQHYQASLQHMQIIKTMFQCDLSRVASFTFGYGNSNLNFSRLLKAAGLLDKYKDTQGNQIQDTEGHHAISHQGGTDPQDAIYIADKFYADITAQLLLEMKNTPDGTTGGSLLDNTLVIYWSEVSVGNVHDTSDMPVLLFGAKFLNLQGGKYFQFGDHAHTMADFWTTTAQAWGYGALTSYSAVANDPMWNKGTLTGLYG